MMSLMMILIFLSSVPVVAFTTSQHISTAILLDRYAENDLQSFMIGFGSHAVIDWYVEDYKIDYNDKGYIAFDGILSAILLKQHWQKHKWAIVGSIAPDIIDAILVLQDEQRWNEGKHLFPFHRPHKQPIRLNRNETVGLSVLLFSFNLKF